MDYKNIIKIEKGKKGGQPTIRGMRITVYDVLQWLASGMSIQEILTDYPELTENDIKAVLQFAADKEKNRFMHKLLVDQNLSYRIIKQIEHLFPGSNHVRLLKLEEADDQAIWHFAKEQGFHIVTKDSDFNDISSLYGFPPKIVRINIGNTSTQAITELLIQKTEIIINFLENKESGILEID